jgi:hypothetical protein
MHRLFSLFMKLSSLHHTRLASNRHVSPLSSCPQLAYLSDHGLKSKGLFRVAACKERVACIIAQYEDDKTVVFEDVTEAANVLKRYMLKLADSLIPEKMFAKAVKAALSKKREKRIAELNTLVQ